MLKEGNCMKFKCTNCNKQTKKIPYKSFDKKPPIGWHWSEIGLLCDKCYESLVKIDESRKTKNCNSDIWN